MPLQMLVHREVRHLARRSLGNLVLLWMAKRPQLLQLRLVLVGQAFQKTREAMTRRLLAFTNDLQAQR